MRLLSSSLIFLACVLSVYGLEGWPACFAEVSIVKRRDQYSSWMVASTSFQIYDIVVTNRGTCPVIRVIGLFSAEQGFINEAWNYDTSTGLITGYGPSLAAGQSFFGAGFVLANSSSTALALNRYFCDDSCSATTAAPTTSAPVTTSAPSTTAALSTTAAPSTTATPSTTAAPTQGGCAVTAVVKRDEYSWLDAGRNTSVYRLTITNAGPCALKDYALSFGYYPGTLLSLWNLEGTRGGYLVKGYGNTLAAGASYSAAGMILAGAPDIVAADPYGANCAC